MDAYAKSCLGAVSTEKRAFRACVLRHMSPHYLHFFDALLFTYVYMIIVIIILYYYCYYMYYYFTDGRRIRPTSIVESGGKARGVLSEPDHTESGDQHCRA